MTNEKATKTILTGQDKSDESKNAVAEPEDDACKDDVCGVQRDMLRDNRLLLQSSTDNGHLLLLLLLLLLWR